MRSAPKTTMRAFGSSRRELGRFGRPRARSQAKWELGMVTTRRKTGVVPICKDAGRIRFAVTLDQPPPPEWFRSFRMPAPARAFAPAPRDATAAFTFHSDRIYFSTTVDQVNAYVATLDRCIQATNHSPDEQFGGSSIHDALPPEKMEELTEKFKNL